MEKLILSRKGFDSASGNGYSPFDPKTGKFIVLPIPEDEEKDALYKYNELSLVSQFFEGINAKNLQELINHPKMYFGKNTKIEVRNRSAHYDPILGRCPWLTNGPEFGAFGQSEAAAGHLRNNQVQEGSIFLFFSRFTPIKYRVHPLDPIGAWTQGAYFIYGWLKVNKVITKVNQSELPIEIRDRHPHGSDYDFINRDNNTIFLAAEKLFEDMDIPGSGYFPKLTSDLLLSSELHKNQPSIWKLPSFFNTDDYRPTYLNVEENISNRWLNCPDNSNYCYVQSAGRGQEYVSNLKDKSLEWLRSLFIDNYK